MKRFLSGPNVIKASAFLVILMEALALTQGVDEWLKRAPLLPRSAGGLAIIIFVLPLILAATSFWLWRCWRLAHWACEVLVILFWLLCVVALCYHYLLALCWFVFALRLAQTFRTCEPTLSKGW